MKSSVSHKLSRMTDVGVILPDSLALEQIKPVSRNVYKKAFDCLREFIGRDFEDSGPSESELISFIKDLREVKKSCFLYTLDYLLYDKQCLQSKVQSRSQT